MSLTDVFKYFAMVKRLFIPLVLLLGISFGVDTYKNAFLVDRLFLMPFAIEYSSLLGLSEKQEKEIKEYALKHEKEVKEKARLVRYLEIEVKRLMLEGEDEQEIKELLTDMMLLKRELSLKNAECIRFLRKTLSKEQFELLKSIALVRLLEEFR